jgi:hypothetical protein
MLSSVIYDDLCIDALLYLSTRSVAKADRKYVKRVKVESGRVVCDTPCIGLSCPGHKYQVEFCEVRGYKNKVAFIAFNEDDRQSIEFYKDDISADKAWINIMKRYKK